MNADSKRRLLIRVHPRSSAAIHSYFLAMTSTRSTDPDSLNSSRPGKVKFAFIEARPDAHRDYRGAGAQRLI
jgi:hypothetical protein